MDTAIILSLIALAGTITTALVGFFRDKKKADIDAVNNLLQKALELNKQELEAVRAINGDLRQQLELESKKRQDAETRLDEALSKISSLEELTTVLQKRLDNCESQIHKDCPK